MLKGVNGSFAGDSRKIVEELVQSLTTFEIVEKCPHRNSSAYEYRSSTMNLRV